MDTARNPLWMFDLRILFALQQALPSIGYTINSQLSGALPYLAALAVTSIFAARTRQPRALAQPFIRGLT